MRRIERLTERETEVLRLLALGWTQREIAGHLQVKQGSVAIYQRRAGDKLGNYDLVPMILLAIADGYLDLGELVSEILRKSLVK